MRRWSKILIGLAAVAYTVPPLLLGPVHALPTFSPPECSGCEVQGNPPRVVADCSGQEGPCGRPRHHHHRRPTAPHHPGKCQLCSSLGQILACLPLEGALPSLQRVDFTAAASDRPARGGRPHRPRSRSPPALIR